MDKNLEYFMSLPYSILIYPEEQGGYTGIYPDLPGCITYAETWAELEEQLKDAKREWIKTLLEEGRPIPQPRWKGINNGTLS